MSQAHPSQFEFLLSKLVLAEEVLPESRANRKLDLGVQESCGFDALDFGHPE